MVRPPEGEATPKLAEIAPLIEGVSFYPFTPILSGNSMLPGGAVRVISSVNSSFKIFCSTLSWAVGARSTG